MIPPKIKICGITSLTQALEISRLGIDALGFVQVPPSPRYMTGEKIQEIIPHLPPFVQTVGVFEDLPLKVLIERMRVTGLDRAQLHGSESPEYIHELTAAGIRSIKAFRIKKDSDFAAINRYPGNFLLVDAWQPGASGGTGKTFDWSLFSHLDDRFQIILAGGITPENVADAILQVKPYGIDLSSGVETSPGTKSIPRIKELLQHIRQTQARQHNPPSSA